MRGVGEKLFFELGGLAREPEGFAEFFILLLQGPRRLFEALLSLFTFRNVTADALNGEGMAAAVNNARTYLEKAALAEFRQNRKLVVLRGAPA